MEYRCGGGVDKSCESQTNERRRGAICSWYRSPLLGISPCFIPCIHSLDRLSGHETGSEGCMGRIERLAVDARQKQGAGVM